MTNEPAPDRAAEPAVAPREKPRLRRILRGLLRVSAVIVPLIVIPALVTRNVYARARGPATAGGPVAGGLFAARQTQIQNVVDALRVQMSIPETVVVSLVEHNDLVV